MKPKPCPFCGIPNPLIYRAHEAELGTTALFIDCSGCNNIDMGPFESKEQAIELWNTRVPEERTAELIATLQAQVDLFAELLMEFTRYDGRRSDLHQLDLRAREALVVTGALKPKQL